MADRAIFHLFGNLPAELRLKIWTLILDCPRTIEISCERGIHPGPVRYAKEFRSHCPSPALLYVNREARHEALKIYAPYFQTEHSTRSIYMAFDRDIVKLREDVILYLGDVETGQIESMSIVVEDHYYFGHFNMDKLRNMLQLKQLELVVKNSQIVGWDSRGCIQTLQADFDETKEQYPMWECPRVGIISQE